MNRLVLPAQTNQGFFAKPLGTTESYRVQNRFARSKTDHEQ